tara:strand:- start:5788 stop:6993 length:1206 start_codon:yes stop_codon:yes gene_type:complete
MKLVLSKKVLICSFIIFPLFFIQAHATPSGSWDEASPEDMGVAADKVEKLFDLSFRDDATQSVVLIKDGVLIAEKYADGFDKNSFGTSWSMAKSYYAALILISVDKGEINSLDDKASEYLDYFNDDRSEITIRQLLNMSSGLEYPETQHEMMFFQPDHLEYSKKVGLEKKPDTLFEYNNVNSMLLGDILLQATGKKADVLLEERILDKLEVKNKTLWRDSQQNVLTYCCIDMSARDYARFGQLFSNSGEWHGEQIISKEMVDETFQYVWDTPNWWTDYKRGYSLHWWVSRYTEDSKIFNASGRFGQYIFVDRDNDIVFVRITKNTPAEGPVQNWSRLSWFTWINNVELLISFFQTLENWGIVKIGEGANVNSPSTREEGASKEFYRDYDLIMDAMADLSQN